MELTKEQEQRIEDYLDAKNITYIDIRFEILDHIISDIESTIEKEKTGFESAFKIVTKKWNIHLEETSSWLFGVGYSAPKIVLEKAKKQFKKWFFLPVFVFLFLRFIIDKINIFLSENLTNRINLFFQIITVLCFVVFAFILLKKDNNKVKTTYSFILKTQSLSFLIGVLVLFDFNFLNDKGNLDASQIGFLSLFIFQTFICYHFYKKHRATIKNYELL